VPTNTWDETLPADTQAANLLGADLRGLKLDVQERMALISGLAAGIWNPGADAQPLKWTGLLYFATDTGKLFQWSGAAWVDVTANFFSKTTSTLFDASIITTSINTTGIAIPANTLAVGSIIDLTAAFSFNNGAGQAFYGLGINGTSVGQNAASPVNPVQTSFGLINVDILVTAIGAAGSMTATLTSQSGPINSIIGSALNNAKIAVDTTNIITIQLGLATGGLVASLGPTKALIY
jgi:hypothetical protein